MDLGLNIYKQHESVDKEQTLGRIFLNSADMYKVMRLDGSENNAIPKKRSEQFLVGDWVTLDPQIDFDLINERLPRYSTLGRITGEEFHAQEKDSASNIDQLFICFSMNKNLKTSRINRFLYALKKENEYQTSIVLTKSDLFLESMNLAQQIADKLKIPVFCTSCITGKGLAELRSSILPGQTVSFYGNSGVGKSSLINAIAQKELMSTNRISAKTDKGRHTTTSSRLIPIELGDFVLIDTPGIKSMGVSGGNLKQVFPEIADLSEKCRFNDCKHIDEPDCAVKEAVNNGTLERKVYDQFIALEKESQVTKGYLDQKLAKKLNKKAEFKKATINYHHYRKPPM
ncbi:hypothetical protein JF76_14950 [Lactobacillus kullabergensis]|uniref:Small ribosomal subunit biogenesis GTPase RsgA n=1 Tax=Lactobacillus kullabergensis TaxID=1218493 RepID=A0A0F4L770_9LACO|nr:ribosome small subunit-dependent GTPase A [Lactobacillus kullabergensis]KJY54475.1 hypothetical protein JF76_14950 [Lactobacillus kullabergensis]